AKDHENYLPGWMNAKLVMLHGQVRTAIAATKSLNQLFPEPVSVDTVRRGFSEIGMMSEKVGKKPALNKKRIKQGMPFAKKYQEWTVGDSK
ncbi:hypothetical protein BGX21_006636, partial [Mortierella sp. AD011]